VPCRGVFFAITVEEADSLLEADGDDELMQRVEAIEMRWDADNLAECDKAWDAMHRVLASDQ
jgi:hypothetical protein